MRLLLVSLVAACGGPQRVPEAPPCPTDRKLVISTQDDARRAAACTSAIGLMLRTGATVDLAPLHELETIDGDLHVGPTIAVTDVSLPALRRVGGTIHIGSNGALHGLYLPRLEEAGRIEIDGNVSLSTVSLPRLATVHGAVVITDNAELELVEASSLVTVGGELVVTDHPNLALLQLGKLVKSDAIRIERAPKLPPELVDRVGRPPPAE